MVSILTAEPYCAVIGGDVLTIVPPFFWGVNDTYVLIVRVER